MRSILLIGAHFDDAVLSAGQFLAERPDADVVTVFAGIPLTPDNILTPYDEKCGFTNARDAVGARTRENDNALALLEANPINLEFPDSQYETELANHVNVGDITAKLQEIVDAKSYEFIMAPLGLAHPDHIKVTDAVMSLKTKKPLYLWEDLPLRVVEPQLVPPRLQTYGLTLDKLWATGTNDHKIAKKIRAMTCYKSQINTGILDPYFMYVPERFWKYRD
jgi:LmbE family N-acetylglucosaminyl deacetylase